MSSGKSLVSVLITNYNYGRFLAQAIDSALAQSYRDVEIIIVDDGSVDNSHEVIRRYGTRIIPIFKANEDLASALSTGFSKSTGDWILFLDSDDLYAPSKVETLMSYASKFPSAGMIAHNFDYCDAEGNPTTISSSMVAATSVRLVDDRAAVRSGKCTVALPPTSALALRRDTASKIFPVPQETRQQADRFIKWGAVALTPVLVIPEFLSTQRIHGRNCYTDRPKTEDFILADCVMGAGLAYRMKERFPALDKIAWKTYGAIAYRLMALRSKKAKEVRDVVRLEYGLLEWSLPSLYNVGGAFVAALVRDFLRAPRMRITSE